MHPIRDALAGIAGEQSSPLTLSSAVVTAVSGYAVTLQLADGTTLDPLPYLGWWAPRVGDVTALLVQGPLVIPIGAMAQAALATGTPPAPPAPPTPPVRPPSTRTVNIQPIDCYGYYNGWHENDLRQGGPSWDTYFFYGSRIAAAKGSGTITAAKLIVTRLNTNHGVKGNANIRIGTHSQPGPSGAPMGFSYAETRGVVGRGKTAAPALSPQHVVSLNAGALGVGLVHGNPSYTSPDYLRVKPSSGTLQLTVRS